MTFDPPATTAGSARADGPLAEAVGNRCSIAEPARAGAAAPVARSRS